MTKKLKTGWELYAQIMQCFDAYIDLPDAERKKSVSGAILDLNRAWRRLSYAQLHDINYYLEHLIEKQASKTFRAALDKVGFAEAYQEKYEPVRSSRFSFVGCGLLAGHRKRR